MGVDLTFSFLCDNVAILNKPPFPAFSFHYCVFKWLTEDGWERLAL